MNDYTEYIYSAPPPPGKTIGISSKHQVTTNYDRWNHITTISTKSQIAYKLNNRERPKLNTTFKNSNFTQE